MIDSLVFVAVLAATFWAMEGIAWAGHKYLMHGPLWFIHRSHHEPSESWFELNDVYGLVFAVISVASIYYGYGGSPALHGFGWGIALYGVVYFLVHDVLVHRRVHHRFIPKSGYLQRLYEAHRLHHAVRGRDGAVSFGFVLAPNPEKLAEQIRANRKAGIANAERSEHREAA